MSDSPGDASQNPKYKKSCSNCSGRKRKCKGGLPCLSCIKRKLADTCQYLPRKKRVKKNNVSTSNNNNNDDDDDDDDDNNNNNDNTMPTATNLQTQETTAAVNNISSSTSLTAPAVNTSDALITYSISGQPQTLNDPKLGGKFEVVPDGSGGYHLVPLSSTQQSQEERQQYTPLAHMFHDCSICCLCIVQSLNHPDIGNMLLGGGPGTDNNDNDNVDNVNNHNTGNWPHSQNF